MGLARSSLRVALADTAESRRVPAHRPRCLRCRTCAGTERYHRLRGALAVITAGVVVASGAVLAQQAPSAAADGAAASPAAASGTAARGPAASGPATAVTISGKRVGPRFEGVGAISAGASSRYLIDYPAPQRHAILDYLFTPHYGASLQLLKLEIGGDSNSSNGAEPSVEHTRGVINCKAGYEWWIARQALRRNPRIKLYGLQWGAPGWTADRQGTLWTARDVNYVINWLNCAKSHGLTISYLGGRDEAGINVRWYELMRAALNRNGYRRVKIVVGDENDASRWIMLPTMQHNKQFAKAVSIIGVHDSCGPAQYRCVTPGSALRIGKPLWMSEQGGLDANTGAAGMVRVINRMYVQGHMRALLECPLLTAMPPGLPFEDRGLIYANQPWSGNYTVNLQTWATAQTTQFTQPGWSYVRGGDGLLGDSGSYVTYVSPDRRAWSMVAENTGSAAGQVITPQRITVTVTGGLRARNIHVWATNLESADPSQWFVKEPSIRPSHDRFHYVIPPGYVVTFTTTSGQSKAGGYAPPTPPPGTLPLPYHNSLKRDDGSDQAPFLATLDGAFGLVRCLGGVSRKCLQQLTPQTPVLWHSAGLDYPYAIIGDPSWANYTVSVKVLLTRRSGTAGVIGRFTLREHSHPSSIGLFNGYMLDLAAGGAWRLLKNSTTSPTPAVLASGQVPPLTRDSWHTLSLSMNGTSLTASIDGTVVGSVTDSSYSAGLAGLEAGAFTQTWPIDQYRDLTVTPLGPGTTHSG
jgi:hypothetical protein